jgi:hypothetical protein
VTEAANGPIEYAVTSLSSLDDEKYSSLKDRVFERLANFECSRSSHLQEYARSAVHRWEEHGHSKAYVFVSAVEDDIDVPAFFSVGMATLDLSEASAASKKKIMGNISLEQTGAFSIAELARSDRYSSSQLPGTVILDEAKEVIRRARGYVGGRFLVVDSRPSVFESLYQPQGFKKIGLAKPPIGMEDSDFVTSCCVIKDW